MLELPSAEPQFYSTPSLKHLSAGVQGPYLPNATSPYMEHVAYEYTTDPPLPPAEDGVGLFAH